MEGKGERGGEVEGRVRRGRIGKKEDVVGRPSFGGERLGRRWRGGEGELIWKRGRGSGCKGCNWEKIGGGGVEVRGRRGVHKRESEDV